MKHCSAARSHRPIIACLLPLFAAGEFGGEHGGLLLAVGAPVRGAHKILHLVGCGRVAAFSARQRRQGHDAVPAQLSMAVGSLHDGKVGGKLGLREARQETATTERLCAARPADALTSARVPLLAQAATDSVFQSQLARHFSRSSTGRSRKLGGCGSAPASSPRPSMGDLGILIVYPALLPFK